MSTTEILAYAVIGLAVLLVVSGILFLVGLSALEKISDWRVDRAGRIAARAGSKKSTPLK